MPTVFVNGGAPLYIGYQFTTAVDLIDTLETNLVSAGWTSVSKVSGTSLFVRGVTSNSHNCWIDFAVTGTTTKTLTLRGWLEEAKTNGSPGATHTLTFIEGSLNRLWLTADSDAGCICLYGAAGSCSGFHFGFLDRIDTTDQWAWMIGILFSHTSYNYAYSAKSAFNGTNWKQLSSDFLSYNDPRVGYVAFALPLTTLNRNTRDCMGIPTAFNNSDFFGQSYNHSPMSYANLGRRNANGMAEIDPYYYREGRGSTTAYGNNLPLYWRGNVKYAYSGVAQEAAAAQCVDSATGYRILSVGGTQWQGMRIL